MTRRYPSVVAIVLHWQQLAQTLGCLASLRRLEYPALQVVVVDNGSTEPVADQAAEVFPGAQVLATGQNLGFAEGNNVGLRHAQALGADWAVLLNDDTVVAPDLLGRLVVAAEPLPQVAAAGPTIYYYDRPDTIWSAGGRIDWRSGRTEMLGLDRPGAGLGPDLQATDWLSGCALLIRRAALERVGLLDGRFFTYFEDVDWCVRASRAGYRLLHVPQARLWHRISPTRRQSSPRVSYYMARNHLLFLHKARLGPAVALRVLLGDHLRTVVSWTVRPRWRGRRAERDALLRGLVDYYRGRLGRSSLYSPWQPHERAAAPLAGGERMAL